MMLKKEAFSLAEVLVVIVLVGLLAAYALPNYAKSAEKSKERMAISNLMAIRAGVELYVTNTNGGLIPTWGDLNTINAALGLSIADSHNTGYHCVPNPAVGVNRCRVTLTNGSQLHFHFDGAHNADGSIHCSAGTCPSCPSNPGDCG